jgi:hypothetical protein
VKLLLSFETIGAAFAFQKIVKNQYDCKIIPTPRCLGVSCSYSAVFVYEQELDIVDFLRDHSVCYSKIFQIADKNGTEVYEEYKY